jgi:heptosyltransferase I
MSRRRVLAIRLGAMGDILHTLPAVASLKQSLPWCHLAWAVEERWAPLLEGNPFVDELVFVNRRSLQAITSLWKQLRSSGFDTVVDFQGLIKSALVAASARAGRIYGYHRSSAREPLAALFYTKTCKPHATHVVDRHLELAASAGAQAGARTFSIPDGRPEGSLPDTPFVLANPLAGWASKQWPREYYAALARKLRENGCTLVLNGPAPIDVPDAFTHVSGLDGLIDATRRARAVIGVDSGPLHLAAALGKPGVAIFGPTDPARNGPYGGSMRVLRSPDARTSYKRTDEIDPSMRAIGPDEVWAALQSQLDR